MTATTAIAPLNGFDAIYDEPGIDLVIAATYNEDGGLDTEMQPVQWISSDVGPDEFDEGAANALLDAAGYNRVSAWDYIGDYAECKIERVTN